MLGTRDENEFPRLIFNSDGDSITLMQFPPPITQEQACRAVEELVGTEVDVFTNSMGRGDDTFSHPTEFGEVYGEGVTEWPEGKALEGIRVAAENTRALLDAGTDIIESLAARAHKRGFEFWPALRMNDIHEDDSARFATRRSSFKKEHQELLIGSPYPTRHGYGYPHDDFTWAFDYAKKEVRDRKLGLILETCEKYDVDGFELDFQRGNWYFKDRQEEAGMALMTDFMRRVRAGTRDISEKRGRRFRLMARVPPTIAKCLDIGLDVPTWIKEELADLFILMDKDYLDMGADVRGLVALARGTSCKIGGGLEHSVKGYGHAGPDTLYAGALSYWRQGASCIYLFNYDCHRELGAALPYTPEEVQVLREIHDPNVISRRNKRYCVTVDAYSRLPEEGGTMPLPYLLRQAGDEAAFTIWVGDDLEAARRDGVLDEVWLRLMYGSYDTEMLNATVSLNGRQLPSGHRVQTPENTTVTYSDVPAVFGENEVAVELNNGEPSALRINGVELVITYGGPRAEDVS